MSRPALAASLILTLSACGQSESPNAPASQPAKPAATDAEKAMLLAALPAPYNAGDLINGRRVFARCRACHTIGEGAPDLAGPNLYGVFGRKAGDRPRYNYSNTLRAAQFVWDANTLDHWLENPKAFLPGNKMTFAGLSDPTDRRDVIAYLKVETGFQPAAPNTPAP